MIAPVFSSFFQACTAVCFRSVEPVNQRIGKRVHETIGGLLLGRPGLRRIDPDEREVGATPPVKRARCTAWAAASVLARAVNARFGQAVVHVMPREQAEAGVAVLGVVPGEEDLARAGAFWIAPKRSGKSGGTSAS
jgi:hypothetical protein